MNTAEIFRHDEPRLPQIEEAIKAISPLVKDIAVVLRHNAPYAYICPDLEVAAKQGIVNISHEIHWYAVELYNIEAAEEAKIRGFALYRNCAEYSAQNPPPFSGEGCDALRAFIATLTDRPLTPEAHLELDLGLDSLDYVQLFAYVQERFGILLDEKRLAALMRLGDLCGYVETHRHAQIAPPGNGWRRILEQHAPSRLLFSPLKMLLFKTLAYPLFKLYFRFDVTGTEHIPAPPCIIAPNHQSMLDGFLIAAALPYRHLLRTFFLAFELVWGRGFVRTLARNGQMVLINDNEGLTASMQASASVLRQQCALVVFPEGARSRDRKLLRFKRFFAILAREYDLPVVPVMIDGSFEALRAGMLVPRPAKIVISFLPAVTLEDEDDGTFTERVKQTIAKALSQ